jgi:hypothetical protein
MAENKTININIKQNADKAEQSFKSYNKELGNTKKQYDAVLKSGKPFDQQLEDINKIVKETPLNVRDMNKQIQAYQSIALSAGRETPVGKQALEQAAQLRDRYVDIQNETKRLADDQRNLEGAMQGLSTGIAIYGGIQSVMALTGVESEKYRETLVKLQAAQTLLNSINQTATALEKESALMLLLKGARTKAATAATAAYGVVTGTTTGLLKAFRIALASTGIGLLVVGIGLLIANFKKLIEVFDPAIDGLKDFADWIGLTNFAEEEREEARIKRAQAEIERQNKLFDLRKQNFSEEQKAFDRRIALIQAEGKQTGILEQLKELNAIKQAKRDVEYAKGQIQRLRLLKRKLDGQSDEAKELEQQIDAFSKAIRESNQQIADSNNQLKINTINANKEKKDSYKNYANERKNAARQIEDLENSLLEEGIEKELEINRDKFKRLREDAKGNAKERARLRELYTEQEEQAEAKIREKYDQKEIDEQLKLQAEFDKIREQNEARLRTDEENELFAVATKYDKLEAMAQGNAEALNEIEIARLNAENEIKLKYQEQQYNNEKAINDKKRADEKALADYRIKVAQQSLTAISDIAELFAKGNEKQQKRAFQIQKAVGIAQATINTAQAITKVFAETTDFTPTQSLRIANAVAIGVAGAAQIAAIASQQFQGGGDVESPTSISAGGEAVAPQFNVVGDSGVNQLAQIQQQPVQAYVVSGEVTTSQALDRNRVENATL